MEPGPRDTTEGSSIFDRQMGRREFAGLVFLGLLAACAPVPALPPQPETSPTPVPVSPARPSPTPEIPLGPATISSEFLVNGLAAVGGESSLPVPTVTPDGGLRTEPRPLVDLFSYASKTWDETVSANTVGEPISALKFLLAYAEMTGIEGKIDLSRTFSQLPFSLGRITIGTLPNNAPYEAIINGYPTNLTIRKGTHLTIVGGYTNESGKWATVAFDDFGRQDKDKNPRLFLATLPLTLENPQDGQTSLAALLKANGGSLDPRTGTLTLPDGRGGTQRMSLNTIETTRFAYPEDLRRKIEKAVGAYFVDAIGKNLDGTPILHPTPVVPYPPEDLVGRNARLAQMENGTIVAYETNTNTLLATASYHPETRSWEWGLPLPELHPTTKTVLLGGVDSASWNGVTKEARLTQLELSPASTVEPVIGSDGKYHTLGPFLYARSGTTTGFVLKEAVRGQVSFTDRNSRELAQNDVEMSSLGLPSLEQTKQTPTIVREWINKGGKGAFLKNYSDQVYVRVEGGIFIDATLNNKGDLVVRLHYQDPQDVGEMTMTITEEAPFTIGASDHKKLPVRIVKLTNSADALLAIYYYMNQWVVPQDMRAIGAAQLTSGYANRSKYVYTIEITR